MSSLLYVARACRHLARLYMFRLTSCGFITDVDARQLLDTEVEIESRTLSWKLRYLGQ